MRWQPFPFLVLALLVIVTGSIDPSAAPVAYWIAFAITVAVFLAAIGWLIVRLSRGKPAIDADGNILSLAALTIVDAEPSDRPPTPVADTARHQNAIDAAQAFGRAGLRAVLVPDASRWLGLRLRVGVQLLAGDRVFHAGFLDSFSDAKWNELLRPLRASSTLVAVPVAVSDSGRPLTVSLDLGGVADAVRSASHQQPHS